VPLEVSTAANGRAGDSQAGGEQTVEPLEAPPETQHGPPRQSRPRADQPSAPPTASPSSGPAPPSRRSRRRRPGHPNAAPQHQPGVP
jgi:hypothetical protein